MLALRRSLLVSVGTTCRSTTTTTTTTSTLLFHPKTHDISTLYILTNPPLHPPSPVPTTPTAVTTTRSTTADPRDESPE
ncbi:hypothetical protein D0860_08078 [Hortaea werneckii]|uniref:Uncharacterized protein n=1 Tax=Hortaea werneckii TaxID=91943 RepID=A0A3M7GH86_HORWE|nr:hypothetical protein D0860_08078 [Hortaea werneckii]